MMLLGKASDFVRIIMKDFSYYVKTGGAKNEGASEKNSNLGIFSA